MSNLPEGQFQLSPQKNSFAGTRLSKKKKKRTIALEGNSESESEVA